MKINFGAITAITNRVPKKIIMPALSLLFIALAAFFAVNIIKSCVEVKRPNTIDIDILEPDGTINQKKIFQESIKEDIEKSMRYYRKGAF